MKNKFIKILSIVMAGIAVISITIHPVFATSESESSEVSPASSEQPSLEPSTLVIEAYNTDSKKYLSSMSFEIFDRTSNSLVTFSKIDSGEYSVDNTGRYKYIETYDGYVEIKGLNGNYDIRNILGDGDIKCDTQDTSLSIKDEERKTVRFEYSANYGTVKVEFHAEDDSSIPNAKFNVKDDNGTLLKFVDNGGIYEYNTGSSMTEISTNSAGSAILHIPSGKYTITQTSAPVEYNGDYVTKTFTISNQDEVTLKMINTKEYGDLIISVSDVVDSTGITGAEFTIADVNGNSVYVSKNTEGSYSFSFTSGEGIIVSSGGNIALSGIPKGSYVITQKTSAAGFETAGTKEFDIKAGNTTNIKITNERSVGNLTIKVTDEETGDPVENVVYRILQKDGEQPISFKQTSKGYEYSPSGSNDVETDENGEIILEKIPVGNYFVSQVGAAKGYLLDVNDVEQSVLVGQTSEYKTIAVKSNSTVIVMNTDGEPVKNVSFTITNSDGNVLIEDKTNDDGKYVIAGLPEGEYILSVSNVPETYAKYKKTVKFKLDLSGKSDGLGKITLDYTKASLNLGKKGIGVVLTNKEDGSAMTISTDENGIATFSQLEYGEYGITLEDSSILFTEIKFTVDEEFTEVSYNVDLSANADASESELESIEESTSPENPVVNKKVNNNVIMVIIAALIALTGGVYGYFVYKKKKGEETSLLADDSIKVGYDEDGNAILYEEIEVELNESEQNADTTESEDVVNDESTEISENENIKADESLKNVDEEQNLEEAAEAAEEESKEPKVVSDSDK